MVTLKSQRFEIFAPAQRVVDFLSQTQNYGRILPSGQISDFKSTDEQFSFKAAGQIVLALEKKDCAEQLLHFKGLPSNPFAFDLYVHLEAQGPQTSGHIELIADLNMMLKMLVEKPLQKLLAEMAENLSRELV